MATRAPTTRSSCSPRGAAGRPRSGPDPTAARQLGGAIEAVARDLARQQAADGEGATTLLTCQVTGALDDAEARAVARSVVGSSWSRRRPTAATRTGAGSPGAAGNAHLADAAVLEAAGLAADEADGAAGRPVQPRSRPRCGSRSPDRPSSTARPAGRSPSTGRRPGPRWTLPRSWSGSTSAWATGSGEAFGCDLTEEYVIENSEYTT